LALAPVQTDEGVDEKGNIGQAETRVEVAQRGFMLWISFPDQMEMSS
jgi:hypothetical protein